MAACSASKLRVLLPPGGQGVVWTPHRADTEGPRPDRRPDRMDKHRPLVDSCGYGIYRGACRRPILAQMGNNYFAHFMVADDVYDGICRRLDDSRNNDPRIFRRHVLPLNRHGSRRELLRPLLSAANCALPQENALDSIVYPPGRALLRPYGVRRSDGLGARRVRQLAARLHGVRRSYGD